MLSRIILIACTFYIYHCSPVFAAEIWKVATLNWEPYADSKISSQGTAITTLREILKQADIELVVEFYPWTRAKGMARRKDFVGYFPSWHEAVIDGFVPSSAVAWSGYGVMTYKDSGLEWKGLEELFKHRIGLVPSYIYPGDVSKMAKRYPDKVDSTPNELSLVKKLSKKRFKAAISGPEVMRYIANKHGITNIVTLHSFPPKEMVLAFRDEPDNQARMVLFEKLLKQYFASAKGK
ncbi:hypothetical protein [Maridesulfovibrio sp.]|uniref:hypothetical protein n=1 Tax=Maridesulfovibrio sp. TaxID=2795000 RepID=UPI003BA9E6AA